MLILATMLVELFNFKCSVGLSKRFFLLFLVQHRKLAKAKKGVFLNLNYSLKFSQLAAQCAIVLSNLGIIAILLANHQRWSPRGQILKSLALASKVKSLLLQENSATVLNVRKYRPDRDDSSSTPKFTIRTVHY